MSKMKLVNVTNSYSRLVLEQLENTDAELVKVYTAGNLTIVYTEAPLHNEILIVNKNRTIRSDDVAKIKDFFLSQMAPHSYDENSIDTIEAVGLVEISIKKQPQPL